MKTFDYHKPTTLEQAISLLTKYREEAKLLAGGTDVIVEIRNKALYPKAIIDLKSIPDLHGVRKEKETLRIGALVTIREIETSSLFKEEFSILAGAAKVLGSIQVRNRATLGGNICHASPAADMVPPLIGLKSKVKIVGSCGERLMELEDFLAGPGKTKLELGEILKEIIIPKQSPNCKGVYLKLSPRKLTDLAVVGVAIVLWGDRERKCEDLRITLGSVAPRAIRAKDAERTLIGNKVDERLIYETSEKAMKEASPITDIRGSDWYRREMVKVLIERGLRELCEL